MAVGGIHKRRLGKRGSKGGSLGASIRSAWVWKMNGMTREGTAEPVSRDEILGRVRRQEKYFFPRSADHDDN